MVDLVAVSYTHLDVYKRQVMCQREAEGRLDRPVIDQEGLDRESAEA